jgi:hypothetical protein
MRLHTRSRGCAKAACLSQGYEEDRVAFAPYARLVLCRTTPHRRFRTTVITHRSKSGLLAVRGFSSAAFSCQVLGCQALSCQVTSVQTSLAGLCDAIATDTSGQDDRDRNGKPDPHPFGGHISLPTRDHLLAGPHRRFRAAVIAHADRPCGLLNRSSPDILSLRIERDMTPVLRSGVAAEPGGQSHRDSQAHKTHPRISSIHIGHIILQSASAAPLVTTTSQSAQVKLQYFATTGPPNLKSRPSVTTE